MPEYAGEFEMHLTVRAAADAMDHFRSWCASQGFRCTEIVLARGASVHQPMATWHRRDTTLSEVRHEIDASVLEAQLAGFEVVRRKIEAGLHNMDVPRAFRDAEAHPRDNYFEHHLKLRRPVEAPLDALIACCQQFGAHLSRNALRQPEAGVEERFVTLRSYDQGRLSSRAHLARLQEALQSLGECVVEVESEYCVFDSNLALDTGWLPAAEQQPPAVTPSLPVEVCNAFLYGISLALPQWREVAIVLRGSILLHHWFGDAARPPADLDLECFSLGARLRGGELSIVDRARRMCWDALDLGLQQGDIPEVVFDDVDPRGESLFEYGSAGTRRFVCWTWRRHSIPVTGELQIDFSTPRSIPLAAIDAAQIWVPVPVADAPRFQFWAYTLEMQLAAKLSWLLRSFQRRVIDGVVQTPIWTGEPKDLFDVNLLLTSDDLRPHALQRCLLVVGEEDRLDWSQLDVVFDVRRTRVGDSNFHNWPEFARLHPRLIQCGPAQMAVSVVDRLEPLLGDLYRSEESGFLQTIHAAPNDETGYLVYADWLEDRGDPRARFLQLYAARQFQREPTGELRQAAREIVETTPTLWLVRLFRTHERARQETEVVLNASNQPPFI